MRMFELTGLKVLHKDMVKKGEERVTFPFEFNEKSFSCIFLTDIIPYRLYLTTLGLNPMVFELEIKRGYVVECYIQDYSHLMNYLGIKYDPTHKFLPVDFFRALNDRIPSEFKMRPDYKDIIKIVSKRRDIEDEDKVYFCGWRRNPIGQRVQEKNLEKTRSAFGDKKAEICKINNISSCWTDYEDDEALKRLNEINTM